MKKYFNGKGTITGWQAIGRFILSYIAYGSTLAILSALFVDEGWKVLFLLPLVVLYIWFTFSTAKKRYQSFGFEGGFLNFIFPSLTDGTYPNGHKEEK